MGPSRRMVFGRLDYAAFMTYFAYAAGSVVVPVALVSLARELGFSLEAGGMTAGGALHLGRTFPMVGSMLLCGFAAGHWGTRRTFGWSVLLMGLGVGGCALAPGYTVLLAALMLAGLGEGAIEGLGSPFVQDLHPDEPGRYINFSHAFWSVGVLVTVLVSGALLADRISWRWVVGGVGALAILPAALLLLPERRPHGAGPAHTPLPWQTVWGQARTILRIPRFWLFFAAMFVAGGGEFCLTFWSASYIQLHFGLSAWAGGVGTAFFAGGMVLGRTGWGYVIRQHQLHALILLSALAGTVVTAILPFAGRLWAFSGLLFLAGIATAPYWPSLQSRCADRLPGTDTTMLYILLSCAGVPGCGVFTWLMGCLGDGPVGLGRAFLLVPFCYVVLAALMVWDGRAARNAAMGVSR